MEGNFKKTKAPKTLEDAHHRMRKAYERACQRRKKGLAPIYEAICCKMGCKNYALYHGALCMECGGTW